MGLGDKQLVESSLLMLNWVMHLRLPSTMRYPLMIRNEPHPSDSGYRVMMQTIPCNPCCSSQISFYCEENEDAVENRDTENVKIEIQGKTKQN